MKVQTDQPSLNVLTSSIRTHLFSFESLLSFLSPPAVGTSRASLPLRTEHTGSGDRLEVQTWETRSTNHTIPVRPFSPADLQPAGIKRLIITQRQHMKPRGDSSLLMTHSPARFSSRTLAALAEREKRKKVRRSFIFAPENVLHPPMKASEMESRSY